MSHLTRVLFVLVGLLALSTANKVEWPQVGLISFDFVTPYANTTIPYTINFDYKRGVLKESVFDDLNYTTFHFAENSKHVARHVMPNVDKLECYSFDWLSNTDEGTFDVPHYLPDLNDGSWTLAPEPATVDGIQCARYTKSNQTGDKLSVYDFYVVTDSPQPIPLLWTSHARAAVFNAHTDVYEIHYRMTKWGFTQPGFDQFPSPLCDENNVRKAEHLDGMRHVSRVNSIFGHNGSKLEALDEVYEPAFEVWASHHGRKYASHAEKRRREGIFLRRQAWILEHNSRTDVTYGVSLNEHADREVDEILATRGGRVESPEAIEAIRSGDKAQGYDIHNLVADDDVPDNLDWRIEGFVDAPADQVACGSCWTFSCAGTLSGRFSIRDKKPTYISPQAIVDCFRLVGGREGKSFGCFGGSKEEYFLHMKKTGPSAGVGFNMEYPYLGIDDYCHKERLHTDEKYRIKDVHMITPGDEAGLMKALVSGPVSISIAVPEELLFYAFGVFDMPESADMGVGHDVGLVGAGTTVDGTPYWIVRNSWSAKWGNNGYAYVKRGENQLNITACASYVDV